MLIIIHDNRQIYFQGDAPDRLFNLMSRFLGLLRDVVIARQFGAGDLIDAYQMALKMPNMLLLSSAGPGNGGCPGV